MYRSICRSSGLMAAHRKPGHVPASSRKIPNVDKTAVQYSYISSTFRNAGAQITTCTCPIRPGLAGNHHNTNWPTRYQSEQIVRNFSTESPNKEADLTRIAYKDKASLTGMQKKLLVWTGCYRSEDEIPDKIRVELLGKSFRIVYLLTSTWYMIFILMTSFFMIFLWKREWSKGVESELRNTLVKRDTESETEFEHRFQQKLKKDIHFMRHGYELDRPGSASWRKEAEIDPQKFSDQRERLKEKHLDKERKEAMRQYATETDAEWEKHMEQQLKQIKK